MFIPLLLANTLIMCGKVFPLRLTPKTDLARTTIANMRDYPEQWHSFSDSNEGTGVERRIDMDTRCGISFTRSNAFHRKRYADQVNYPLGIWDMALIFIATDELAATQSRTERLTAQSRITAALGDGSPLPMLHKSKAPKQLL